MTVRELLVSFEVATDTQTLVDFDRRIERVRDHASLATDAWGVFTGAIQSALRWLIYGVTALAGWTTALIGNSVAVAGDTDEIIRHADALGITTDAYQELTGAFAGADIGADQVDSALGKLGITLQKARDGGKAATEAFDRLGIKVSDLKGLKLDQVMSVIADGMKRTDDPAKKLAASMVLFGRGVGREMVPVLSAGADALDKLRKAAATTGYVMSAKTLKAGQKLDDNVDALMLTVRGLRTQIAGALFPALIKLTDGLLAWYAANKDVIASKIIEWGERFGDTLVWLGDKARDIDKFVRERLGGWENVFYRIGEAVLFVAGAFIALRAAGSFLTILYSIIGAVSALLDIGLVPALVTVVGVLASFAAQLSVVLAFWGTLYLAVEDFYYFVFDKGDSLLGEYVKSWQDAGGALGTFAQYLLGLKDIVGAFVEFLYAFIDAATVLGGIIATALKPAFDDWYKAAKPVLDIIAELFGWFASSALQDAIDKMKALATILRESASGWRAIGNFAATGNFVDPNSVTDPQGIGAAIAGNTTNNAGNKAVQIGGDTYHVSGGDTAAVRATIDAAKAAQRRATLAALGTGER